MLDQTLNKFRSLQGEQISGAVKSYDGLTLDTDPFPATVGSICKVCLSTGLDVFGEVILISSNKNVVSLYQNNQNVRVGDRVTLCALGTEISVDSSLLGRVMDARGEFLDAGPKIIPQKLWPLHGKYTNPVTRAKISEPLDVGIRSINAALTIGKGQRIGVISGSGVGKSSLIAMITEFTKADVVIIGLIGERGREVADFVHKVAQLDNFENTIIVAETANSSPLLRIKGAQRATALAEYFRDQGKDVLLILDSLTRVAHAQREIGLSRGEATIAKGYTASVLDMIPNLVERAGTGLYGGGSVTAIYTVLADGDDVVSDPIVDASRAILDGHITLSRQQAAQGIYPAIDVTMSISRVMNEIVDNAQVQKANRLRGLIATYLENRDLVLMGGYSPGQNKDLDLAMKNWPKITKFLKQSFSEPSTLEQSVEALNVLVKE
jgi:flagellum-specific ATP synthase